MVSGQCIAGHTKSGIYCKGMDSRVDGLALANEVRSLLLIPGCEAKAVTGQNLDIRREVYSIANGLLVI